MPKTIVAIVGTYRKAGVINTAVDEILKAAQAAGAQTSKIYLIDKHIEFCTNCRACTQQPGLTRGVCPLNDDISEILDRLDAADALVIASPINFFNVTAVTRKFLERLLVYAYWPWGPTIPKLRVSKRGKKVLLVTASAAPAWLGKLLYRQVFGALKMTAQCLGAKVIARLYFGMVAQHPDATLNPKQLTSAYAAGLKLAQSI